MTRDHFTVTNSVCTLTGTAKSVVPRGWVRATRLGPLSSMHPASSAQSSARFVFGFDRTCLTTQKGLFLLPLEQSEQ